MREFIITTDSAVDLPMQYLTEHNNEVLSLSYMIGDEIYEDMHGLPYKEFYARVRAGALPTTSQVNPDQAKAVFERLIKEGKDILHIGFSSGLSGSYNSASVAAQELKEEYADAKIIVIDSLCASLGEGLLLYKVNEMKEHGSQIDEIAKWVEENKLFVCHNVVVDDLNHLHRGGRVSKAAAVLGTVVNIKPILNVNNEGGLVPVNKIRGRKKALSYLVEKMGEQMKGFDNDIFTVCHGDCEEDAVMVAEQIQERYGINKYIINPIGPVIGTHAGPGTIGIFFMGNPR